jgi:predicted N-acetyltransferase YhbS
MGFLAEPVALGDGLVLRSAATSDIDQIVSLSVAAHGPHEAAGVRHVVERDGIDAWTVVVDGEKVVSTSVLMEHQLEYGRVQLAAGQIEYVATLDEFRRRGLVRAQFDIHHGHAAERGDSVIFIAGIPYFYRRLGYDYGLRYPTRHHVPDTAVRMPPGWKVVPAIESDVPAMKRLHDAVLAKADLRIPRSDIEWRALVSTAPKWSEGVVVARRGSEIGGWARLQHYPDEATWELLQAATSELAAAEALLAHACAVAGSATLGVLDRPGDPFGALLASIGFHVADFHALYARIPDARRFLQSIAPALSERLNASELKNERGELIISLYHRSVVLAYARGEITDVRWAPGVEDPTEANGVGVAPDCFAPLVLGAFGASGLAERYEDVVLGRHRALMDILFPKLLADVVGVL